MILLTKQRDLGNKWTEIAKFLSGRTEIAVKNRFNCLLKKIKDKNAKVKVVDINAALTSFNQVNCKANSSE